VEEGRAGVLLSGGKFAWWGLVRLCVSNRSFFRAEVQARGTGQLVDLFFQVGLQDEGAIMFLVVSTV
jgi:hypothetical protein